MSLIVNKPPDELVWPEDFVGRIVCGDSLTVLKTMPDQVVQTCITSPPYWGLRDYGVEDQLGLESTPEEYVAKMVEVFREVRRVLKDDGTLWLNLGDSYAQSGGSGSGEYQKRHKQFGRLIEGGTAQAPRSAPPNLKPKDLVGIPWLVALALRADGWYLRSDIIWSKPNPMPESVTDRPTKAHEYLFLLAKSQKYYYDGEAVRETGADTEYTRERYKYKPSARSAERMNPGVSEKGDAFATHFGFGTRNKRSVWTVTTQPFPEAHFATFPEKLIEPCILAGSPEGGIVLDPFFGSGTVGKRSKELSRKWIGIDLNPEYCAIAGDRLRQEELFT